MMGDDLDEVLDDIAAICKEMGVYLTRAHTECVQAMLSL